MCVWWSTFDPSNLTDKEEEAKVWDKLRHIFSFLCKLKKSLGDNSAGICWSLEIPKSDRQSVSLQTATLGMIKSIFALYRSSKGTNGWPPQFCPIRVLSLNLKALKEAREKGMSKHNRQPSTPATSGQSWSNTEKRHTRVLILQEKSSPVEPFYDTTNNSEKGKEGPSQLGLWPFSTFSSKNHLLKRQLYLPSWRVKLGKSVAHMC